jgi:asparagine synthase (glutamine-hydrolysing)
MCGIAGRLHLDGSPIERELLKRMADALIHRGPDGEGYFTEAGVGLAHRRLSIIDLDNGAQPMADAGDRVVTTYNGEIFNWRHLRGHLELLDEAFRTSCDTEALVVGAAAWGDDVLRKLDGQFACALWYRAEKRIVLARDPVGIKPLYWCMRDGALTFASELKAIEAAIGGGLVIDPVALDQYVTYGYVPAPRTIYAGVQKLRPGERLRLAMAPGAEPEVGFFVRPEEQYAPLNAKPYANADELHFDLRDAVEAQLMSDVPLGAFLSGGTDSTSVVMEMCELQHRPRCFTIGFDSDTVDMERAQEAARILGAELTSRIVERKSMLEDLAGVAAAFDEPFCNDSILPTDALCRATRESVTVALSGDGGDELLGGYDHFFRHLMRQAEPWWKRLPATAAGWAARALPFDGGTLRRLAARTMSPGHQYARFHMQASVRRRMGLYSDEFKEALGAPDDGDYLARLHRRSTAKTESGRVASVDFQSFLPEHVLTKVDRLSMRHSLEVRVPVLSRNVIRRCFATPESLKYEHGYTGGKRLLKDVLRRELPDEFVDLKKRGFSSPVRAWMGTAEVKRIGELLLTPEGARIFDQEKLGAFLKRHESGTGARFLLFTLLVMGLWVERHPGAAL